LKIRFSISERNGQKVAHQQLFIPTILNFETTPCEWTVDRRDRLSCQPKSASAHMLLKPWKVREEFLRLDSDRDEILKFLNKTGQFYGENDVLHPVSVDSVKQWRNLLRDLMLERDFSKWERLLRVFPVQKVEVVVLASHFSIKFDWEQETPEVVMSERSTLGAMLATIHLDHARSANFNICARPACQAPFEPKSKHVKLYCSDGCARAEGLKNRRDLRRAQEQTPAQSPDARA
jgi:hypothetical protein